MYKRRQAGKKSRQGQGKGSKFSSRVNSKRNRGKPSRGQGKA
mgnify:CR=1 FL=1